MDGLSIFADGVDEVRKATRMNINEGADVIKVYVSGEGLLRPNTPPEETMYSYEEIAVVVEEAHKRNRQVAAHVRGNDGVKLCVKAGVDVLEHATYADDEAIAMIAERKDDIFVVPGLGYHWGILVNGPACGITAGAPRRDRVPGRVGEGLRRDGQAAQGRRARRAGRRLRLRVVPARPVREGHRAVRDRHGLLADGGDRLGHQARRRAAAPRARVRDDRGRQVRRHPRRRRRSARGHRDPAGPLEARRWSWRTARSW